MVIWRRAQMVLLSAQGMDAATIAKVAFTSEDRVRDVIRNFNADGFSSLYPKYKGGRPPINTRLIVIDPLDERPTVITGSHFLSVKASGNNEADLVTVEGNSELAIQCAVHIRNWLPHKALLDSITPYERWYSVRPNISYFCFYRNEKHMTLTDHPDVKAFILHWGEMATQWGVNRSVAQIHALLYLSDRPLNAEEISDTLRIARSNTSNSLKELLAWKLIRRVPDGASASSSSGPSSTGAASATPRPAR